jgi:hypothetical protein
MYLATPLCIDFVEFSLAAPIYNGVAKYIANEAAKCALDEDAKIMGGSIECDSTTAAIVTALTATTGPLADKDPNDGGASVVGTAPAKARGNVVMTSADTTDDPPIQKILLTTCYDKDCSADKTLTTTVQVFE